MKYELINAEAKADNIISLVFENRGIKEDDIFEYIECSRDYRTNPFEFVNMKEAVEKLLYHIKNKSIIYILCDCDCDGFMSASLMYKLIKKLDKSIEVNFINHKEKKHGLYDEIIEEIKDMNMQLLIIPDAGSNQIEELRKIKKLGIDLLVVDHHEAEYTDEFIIVNNQYNDVNKELSGAAMVLKLAEAIIGDESKEFMDLAAVSIISDSMSMNNLENKYYVKHGLANLKNSFLRKISKNENKATLEDISFNVSPIVNSIIRVGNDLDKTILINAIAEIDGVVELPTRKNGKKTAEYNYQDAAIKISKWRRDEQKIMVQNETEKVDLNHENPINIILLDDDFNRNLSGYFANVLSNKNLKPTLVLKHENGFYKGSARASTIENFKDILLSTELFYSCTGHQGAFGVEIEEDKFNKFVKHMKHMKLPSETVYKVDAILNSNEVEKSDIQAINSLENIWGKGMDKPLFAVKLKDVSFTIMGANQNTLKIAKGGITYIKFNCSKEEIDRIVNITGTVDVDLVGYFDLNVFNGYTNYQVLIKDYTLKAKAKIKNLFDDEDCYFEDLF